MQKITPVLWFDGQAEEAVMTKAESRLSLAVHRRPRPESLQGTKSLTKNFV